MTRLPVPELATATIPLELAATEFHEFEDTAAIAVHVMPSFDDIVVPPVDDTATNL